MVQLKLKGNFFVSKWDLYLSTLFVFCDFMKFISMGNTLLISNGITFLICICITSFKLFVLCCPYLLFSISILDIHW